MVANMEMGGAEDLQEDDPKFDMLDIPRFDEITGERLDPKKVREARAKEYRALRARGVYDHVRRDQAKQSGTGKFVRTRWVETNKGPIVRSRFVAQEFANGDPRDDLFAGTPPTFAARLLVSRAASRRTWTLMGLDVSCAFLYAAAERELYVELPEFDPMAKSGEYVGPAPPGSLQGTGRTPSLAA